MHERGLSVATGGSGGAGPQRCVGACRPPGYGDSAAGPSLRWTAASTRPAAGVAAEPARGQASATRGVGRIGVGGGVGDRGDHDERGQAGGPAPGSGDDDRRCFPAGVQSRSGRGREGRGVQGKS